MLRKYKMGFDAWGLILFVVVMLPNLVWFAIPAPDDVLRCESVTPVADMIASASQVLMIFALCAIVRTERRKMALSALSMSVALCCLLYYICWVLYYLSVTNAPVIIGQAVLPCVAYILLAIERRNMPALIPAAAFTVCHVIFAVCNFII